MTTRYRPITSSESGATLRRIAERHGYTATRGPLAGHGSAAAVIAALECGELATVLIAPEEQAHLLAWLDSAEPEHPLTAETVSSLAQQLREAWRL